MNSNLIDFNITVIFSEDMDRSGPLSVDVAFGSGVPKVVSGQWTDQRTWKGTFIVNRTWQNGTHVFIINDGRDKAGNIMLEDKAHVVTVKMVPLPKPKDYGGLSQFSLVIIVATVAIACLTTIFLALGLSRRKKQRPKDPKDRKSDE